MVKTFITMLLIGSLHLS